MKNKSYNNWNYTPEIESLAFFANLVDEITFNYTIDSFKASTLNVISLMQETLHTIEEVECGNISDGALVSLFDEMREAMDNDGAFNRLLDEKKIGFLIKNIDFKQTPKNVTTDIIQVILDKHNIATEYPSFLMKQLVELITRTDKKEDIENYTRLLITQLRNDGYSDDYIYHTNGEYFFGSNRIESKDDINGFFKLFDYSTKKYEVYFIGHSRINELDSNSKYEVLDEIDNSKGNVTLEKYGKRKTGKSVLMKFSIFAKDPYSARLDAMQRLHKHFSLLNLYHHKYSLNINPYCLVYNREADMAIVIKNTTKAILKCRDQRISKAIEIHRSVVGKLNFNDTSRARFYNALRFHDEALVADSLENQFIDLFTALEILIPKDAKASKDRILQIYDTLVPYLCINYYKKLVDSVLHSLMLWNRDITVEVLGKVSEGTTYVEKTAALMVLKKYDGDGKKVFPLDELYAKLDADHYLLLRNRMYRLHKILKNKKEIVDFLSKHEQRLKWHIDRIYRVRNGIVHAGISPKYLGSLVENLHSYIDILLEQLISDNIDKDYEDINYSFTTCYYRYRCYLANINNECSRNAKENDLTMASEDTLLKSIFI